MKKLFALLIALIPFSAQAVLIDEGMAAVKSGNYTAAYNILQPLALQGNPDAQFSLCGMYFNAQGVPKNDAEAARWCHAAAQNGHVEGMFNLALMYQNGEGVGQNFNQAKHWYKEAADRGFQAAEANLAELDGSNKQIAAQVAQRLAGSPQPQMQAQIQPQQPTMQLAAPAPMVVAAPLRQPVQVASMASANIPVQQLQPAAGNIKTVPDGMEPLLIVQNNEVVDPVTACLIAAQQGKVYDICNKDEPKKPVVSEVVAIAPRPNTSNYTFNLDTENNFSTALEGAKKGDAEAQKNLGTMYKNGNGVAKNYAEALKWLEKSASKGNADAMLNLAEMYQNGQGVFPNPELAYSWYNLAADRTQDAGNKQMALTNVQELSRSLSSEQIGNALLFVTRLDEKIPQI